MVTGNKSIDTHLMLAVAKLYLRRCRMHKVDVCRNNATDIRRLALDNGLDIDALSAMIKIVAKCF